MEPVAGFSVMAETQKTIVAERRRVPVRNCVEKGGHAVHLGDPFRLHWSRGVLPRKGAGGKSEARTGHCRQWGSTEYLRAWLSPSEGGSPCEEGRPAPGPDWGLQGPGLKGGG